MKTDFNISVTFSYNWFEKYFFSQYVKPIEPSDDELERLYLQRKEFLFKSFGSLGIGEEKPVMDGKYINRIHKWCVDFIPFLFGVKLQCIDAGFYHAYPLSEEEISKLKPIDIANYPFSEWILKRKETLVKRYGNVELAQILEGSLNVAYRIRGQEIYTDLMINKDMVKHLLSVITETFINVRKFFAKEFDFQEVFLSNCTTNHISPECYEEFCLKNDVHVSEQTEELLDRPNYIYLHHCDSPTVGKYVHLYSKIPHLYAIDGSIKADIKRVKKHMPNAVFCAFINPVAISKENVDVFRQNVLKALDDGAGQFLLANIDPYADCNRLNTLFKIIKECCEQYQYNPVFDVAPFCEEELEWAFPQYQGKRIQHCEDDISLLIPKI